MYKKRRNLKKKKNIRKKKGKKSSIKLRVFMETRLRCLKTRLKLRNLKDT